MRKGAWGEVGRGKEGAKDGQKGRTRREPVMLTCTEARGRDKEAGWGGDGCCLMPTAHPQVGI